MNLPPLLPTPQGTAEHGSSLPLHIKPRASDTPTYISHNRVLLLSSQAAFRLPSSPTQSVLLHSHHRTGQEPAAEPVTSDEKIQYIDLVQETSKGTCFSLPLRSQQFSTFPSHLLQKSSIIFSTKVTGMEATRFIRVNISYMSEW